MAFFKDADGAVYYMNEKDLTKNMLETSFQQSHNISMTGRYGETSFSSFCRLY